MKISCQSCQAKYTIADEKVLGKVVKIRCKKCGATIVINGAEGHAQAPDDASSGGDMLDYGAGDQWTVNVADGDQRTMSTGEIVSEYRNGTVTSETYCWKDGMDGWLPIRDIDGLFSAVSAPSMHPASAGSDFAPVVPAAAAAPLFGGASPNLFGGGGGGGGGESAPAARRERSRNAGADLFGGVAQAGGEDDRMVAAPAKDEPKLTGQRNESSVLFSLASLTKEGQAENGSSGNGSSKGSPQGDASGLIDIRALSSARAERPKSSGVDDIMNLGGGGAFGAALTAPILAPPAMDPGIAAAADPSAQAGGGGNKGIIFAIVGGVAFLTVAVVLAIVFTRPTTPTEPAATKGGAGATGSGAQAMNDPPKDPGTAAPAPTQTPTAESTAKEPGGGTVGAAKPVAGGTAPKKAEPAAAGGGGGAAPAPAPAPTPAAGGGKPKSMEQAMCEATGTCGKGAAAAPAAAPGAAFDRGAAAASLGGVNVASCKKPDGPSGSGHVTVTFAPSGSVSSAVVDGGPFPGTPVGGCIAGKYRSAHVPAFGGSPVKVGKSFSL